MSTSTLDPRTRPTSDRACDRAPEQTFESGDLGASVLPRRRPPATHPVARADVDRRATRRRPVAGVQPARRVSGTRCAQPVSAQRIRARRTGAVAVVVGVALAFAVWIVGVLGQSYAESVTPQPIATEVVHVRQGDSLSSIAARVAPEMPSATVIDKIVELNDLPSSGLRVGQPLLTPEYR